MRLQQRVAFVTGAATGISRAVALSLAAEGADVVAADLNLAGCEAVAAEIQAMGRRSLAMKLDVTRKQDVEEAMQRTITELGGIDVLFLGAGVIKVDMFHKMKDEDWDVVMDVHVKGAYLCCRAAINHMREKGRGKIITVTSPQGLDGGIGQANYCTAKAAIIGLTKALARENATKGVQVNAICPVAATAMTENIRSDETLRAQFLANIPMKRWAEPEEIAPTVIYLASHDSDYMTGQVIQINGGRTMAS